MILSGKEIQAELGKGINIEPFKKEQLGANSYNLRLANKLLVYTNSELDMKKDNATEELTIPKGGLVLLPGRLYLGKTVEYTQTTKFAPFLEGRSSIARLGLFVHISAGFGNVGSSGCWTLELTCVQPVKIYSDVEICQIYYQVIKGDLINGQSEYHGSRDVQSSFLYKELKD